MDLQHALMNVGIDDNKHLEPYSNTREAYLAGHRDARHQCIDVINEMTPVDGVEGKARHLAKLRGEAQKHEDKLMADMLVRTDKPLPDLCKELIDYGLSFTAVKLYRAATGARVPDAVAAIRAIAEDSESASDKAETPQPSSRMMLKP